MNLPKLVERHVTFRYNGQETGKNLLLVEGNRKLGLEAMAVLEMHNFLEWVTPTLSLRDRVETLFEHYERIKDADPFESLALHWFCAPIEIIESYHEHRQLFALRGHGEKKIRNGLEKFGKKWRVRFDLLTKRKIEIFSEKTITTKRNEKIWPRISLSRLEWIFSATKILLPNENLKQLWTFTPTQRHKTYSMNFLVKKRAKDS